MKHSQVTLHPTFLRQDKQARLRQAAEIVAKSCGGYKVTGVSHLSEKISGVRDFTLDDQDRLATSIPPEMAWLRELWVAAVFGWSVVDLSRLGVSSFDRAISPAKRPPTSPPTPPASALERAA